MAFNSATYYANKSSREAWESLKAARELKARIESGTAYDWEIPRLEYHVKIARLRMRSSVNMRRIAKMK
ncbi:hypothetical protein [Ensifer sp. LCM 4579]|uniref:hypothetical protein n=1 Tax=Ensifer sp. LCM 4579 TaxID=1848292 RepID=UPI0008DA2B4C|nr:hypothetical protein [Ensifer sp. LCM 4579]OHV73353.1 hypothetical protein LCM4579_10555 [Ensifer sp. LCM 4579]